MVEKSGVEKFLAEKSGVERSGLKLEVEMSKVETRVRPRFFDQVGHGTSIKDMIFH